jgi:predicted DNA-binding transcriptional regulator AlpA
MTNTALLGVADVKGLTGLTVDTIKRAARSGDLPVALKMPGKTGAYLFDRADVAEWAARRSGVAA